MSYTFERGRSSEDKEFVSIRAYLAYIAGDQYKSFAEGNRDFASLLVVQYALGRPRSIRYYNGPEEIILPYHNLDSLIEAKFAPDLDKSVPKIQQVKVGPFVAFRGMPRNISGINVGQDVLQKTTFYALKSERNERRMVVSTRFFNSDDTEQTRPFLEHWRAEKRNTQGYLFGKETPVALITSGIPA